MMNDVYGVLQGPAQAYHDTPQPIGEELKSFREFSRPAWRVYRLSEPERVTRPGVRE